MDLNFHIAKSVSKLEDIEKSSKLWPIHIFQILFTVFKKKNLRLYMSSSCWIVLYTTITPYLYKLWNRHH